MLFSWFSRMFAGLKLVATSAIGWSRGINQTILDGPLSVIAALLY